VAPFPCPGCSKKPDFSPAQPWRAETRLVPSKDAASEEARRTLRYVEPLSDARTKLADFFRILLGLFDLFFEQRPVGLSIEGHHGLTFRKITRNGEFFDRQEGLLGVAEFFEFTQRGELAQVL
jgi:hypothetical protein